jgi:hypothetical protein
MESACLPKKSKLRLDFQAHSRLPAAEETGMDEDVRDLIDALCTRAGMLMEDASPFAVGMASIEQGHIPDRLGELDKSIRAMACLIAAAQALVPTKPK